MVVSVLSEKYSSKCHIVQLNCTLSPDKFLQEILFNLGKKVCTSSQNAVKEMLTNCLTQKNRKMVLVVLDEIDQLILANKTSNLNELFKTLSLPNSRLVILGVANQLDLMVKNVDKSVYEKSKPKEIHFECYTFEQICSIVRAKLSCRKLQEIVEEKALSLCARKMAGSSGDLRKVISVLCDSLSLLKCQAEMDPSNTEKRVQELPKVNMKLVHQVLTSKQGPNTMLLLIQQLPLHAKILLLSSLSIAPSKEEQGSSSPKKRKETNSIVAHDISKKYKQLCSLVGVTPMSESEVASLFSTLESNGLLTSLSFSGDIKKRKMVANSSLQDFKSALEGEDDQIMFANILK